jgi:4-amino-4-deoxy-L-arabinose transferase-like glycosyltransferase
MKRFIYLLAAASGMCLLAALAITFQPFQPESLAQIATSDGVLDSLALRAFEGLLPGLMIAAFFLGMMTAFLYLVERGKIGIFDWKVSRFLILILSFQVIGSLIYIHSYQYEEAADSIWYLDQARNLYKGLEVATKDGHPTAYFPIGYPLLLSLLFKIVGPSILAAQYLNILMLTAISLFTYLIGARLFNDRIARRAALLLAFLPSQVLYSFVPIADIPFAFYFAVMAYFVVRRHSIINTIALGILFGAALLTRPILVFYPVIIALFWYLQNKNLKLVLGRIAIIYLIAESILLPWQIRNYRTFDEFVMVSNHGGYNLWRGNNPMATGGFIDEATYVHPDTLKWMLAALNEKQRDSYATKQAISYMLHNPANTVLSWIKKFIHLFYKDSKCITYGFMWSSEQVSPAVLMALIVITEGYYYTLGLAFLIALPAFIKKEKCSPRLWLLAGTVIYFIGIHLPFVADGRYHMPLMPIFAWLAVQHLVSSNEHI